MRRLLVAVAALVLIGGGVTGAAAARSKADSAKSKVLRFGVSSSSVSAGLQDPAALQATDGPIMSIAYAPLIHDNPNGSFSPGLALKWHYVHGHKLFVLTLRHNARFSDGSKVTASAVVKWLNYYLKANNFASGLLGPKPKFSAQGKWTVKIKMEVANPDLPLLLSEENVEWGFVASAKAVAKPSLFSHGTYGAGPYKLDYAKTVPGDHYTFVPNPYYYNKSAIRFKQIYVKAFADSASMLQAQEAGQIDVEWNTDASTAQAAKSAGLNIVGAPFAVLFAQLNPHATGLPALANVKVRQAMNYALNRNAMAKALYGKYGRGTSEFTITPDADPGLENYYKYSPSKAKSLLKAAGYPNGFSFTLDIIPQWQNAASLAAHYLDAVGIKTKVVSYPSGYVTQIFKFTDPGWMLAADVGVPTPVEYPSFLGPTSAFTPGEAIDPQIQKLYIAGLKAKDPAKDWKKMWSLVTKDAIFLPFSTTSDFFYVSKSIGGVKMSRRDPYSFPTEWFPKK